MSSPVLTVFTVLEPNIKKRRMLFPIMSISLQETKESDVRRMIYFLLSKVYALYHFSGC